jgi:hypothetical protein
MLFFAFQLRKNDAVFRIKVLDFIGGNVAQLLPDLDDKPGLILGLGQAVNQGLQNIRRQYVRRLLPAVKFLQGGGQLFLFNRLEQVVYAVLLSSLQGILVIGSGENHRPHIGRMLENIKAQPIPQLYVEKSQIRSRVILQPLQGTFHAVQSAAYFSARPHLQDQLAEPFGGGVFVFYD